LSFSWFIDSVTEFAVSFNGVFWHDTWSITLPPLSKPIDLYYVPSKDFKALIIGLTFGKVLILDQATGKWNEPTPNEYIKLSNVGVFHRCGEWMEWHWDPLVNSLGVDGRFIYPQLGFATPSKPYELRVINNTDLIIFTDVTFWVIRFPNEVECPIWGDEKKKCDVEDLFWKFMRCKVLNHLSIGKALWEILKTPSDVNEFIKKLRTIIK